MIHKLSRSLVSVIVASVLLASPGRRWRSKLRSRSGNPISCAMRSGWPHARRKRRANPTFSHRMSSA